MWEYRTEIAKAKGLFGGKFTVISLEEKFNKLGLRGWELVSFTTSNQSGGSTRYALAIFKKRIE